jgi:RHS repeat-associated protein
MLKIRREQSFALRKQSIADQFTRSGRLTRDAATGDLVAHDANGNVARLKFDSQGFVSAVKSPLGRTWKYVLDADGDPIAAHTPSGSTMTFDYDAGKRVMRGTRDGKLQRSMVYDPVGRLAVTRYPDDTHEEFEYDSNDDLTALRDRLGHRDQYIRPFPGGPLTGVRDGNGNRTTFDYSTWDQPDRTRYADGTTERYDYDELGRVRRITAADGTWHEVENDDLDRPIRVAYDDGEVLTFTYNAHGKLLSAVNQTVSVSYEYDDVGRVMREHQGEATFAYEYDTLGQLAAIVDSSGSRVEYIYDADLRLIGARNWNGGEHRLQYGSDDRSLAAELPNGLIARTGLTSAGLPVSTAVTRRDGGQPLFSFAYTFDDEGRLARFHDSACTPRRYGYDAESQLLSVECDEQALSEVFAYDGAGNRVLAGLDAASFAPANQLLSQGETRCEYDARGNLVAIAAPSGTWRFTYDSRNLLVQAVGGEGRRVRYRYDALARRVSKEMDGVVVRYHWAGDHLLHETRRDGERESSVDYLYQPGSWTPLAQRANGVVYCYHNDHLGTPRRLTDPTGQVVWAADYSAFGEARIRVGTVANPLRFPGQYCDEETNLHYNRFRYYAPGFGRYITRDPVSFLGGTLNLYRYSRSSPTNWCDPVGLWEYPSAKTIATFAVGAVVAVAVTVAVVAAAPVVVAGLGIAAGTAAAAAVIAGVAAVGIVAGGTLGGAAASATDALWDKKQDEKFCWKCVAQGAKVGFFASLPFAALPFLPLIAPALATAGAMTAGILIAGGVSGGIGYGMTTPPKERTPRGWVEAIAAGALIAGVFRFAQLKYGKWRAGRNQPLAETPEEAAARQEAAELSARAKMVTAPIDFDGHVLSGELKANGSVVGGHSKASGNVRVVPGTASQPNANGVYEAIIEVRDPSNPNSWVAKTNNNGKSTMFPDSWSADRIKVEVDMAYKSRTVIGNRWEGVTPSGVKVRGYLAPKTTVYPVY